MWDGFSNYLSGRQSLGGKLLLSSKTAKMKSFVKKAISTSKKSGEDKSKTEKRWTDIYQNSKGSKFYSKIRNEIKKIKTDGIILEHGCSIGLISNKIAKKNSILFGIDRSYHAIAIAKKNQAKNCDYFVANSESHPFGTLKFDLVICLNMLELISPKNLLSILSNQIKKGILILSDPYDFDRGINSVKNPIDSVQLRKILQEKNFAISHVTKKESFISWNLNINPRTILQYKVDFVIAKKS